MQIWGWGGLTKWWLKRPPPPPPGPCVLIREMPGPHRPREGVTSKATDKGSSGHEPRRRGHCPPAPLSEGPDPHCREALRPPGDRPRLSSWMSRPASQDGNGTWSTSPRLIQVKGGRRPAPGTGSTRSRPDSERVLCPPSFPFPLEGNLSQRRRELLPELGIPSDILTWPLGSPGRGLLRSTHARPAGTLCPVGCGAGTGWGAAQPVRASRGPRVPPQTRLPDISGQ